uniref:Uncharacterized protein n=1 Tax=Rhizophora mucronata TaxID=61149 RepID=A0A2P2NK04_RHIMU
MEEEASSSYRDLIKLYFCHYFLNISTCNLLLQIPNFTPLASVLATTQLTKETFDNTKSSHSMQSINGMACIFLGT